MKDLIIGMGEIGTSVKAAVCPEAHTYDIKQTNERTGPVDVMHLCFPYSESFVQEAIEYRAQYEPRHTLVWSTVPIGTTKRIPWAAHSPVEGKHPDLELSIRTMTRWVGANYPEEAKFFFGYFTDKGLKVRSVANSDWTEFLKLRSTAKYGINLVWTDYEASVADKIDMDFALLKEFDKDYNKLYHELGADWAQRYLLDPPAAGLGGHCLIENGVLLDEQYPSKLLKSMLALGKNTSTIKEDKPYLNRAWLYAEYIGKKKSTEQIGAEWGCTGANIIRVMARMGIKCRDSAWTKQEVIGLEELSKTMTFKEVAEHLGRSYDAIRIQASKMAVESIYNPSERDEKTRRKISASLQGITEEEWDGFKESVNSLIRKSEAMQEWRKAVFERDDYTCQVCQVRSKKGQAVILHADHIKRFAEYPELRFDISNGRTLCVDCHRKTDTWGGRKVNK